MITTARRLDHVQEYYFSQKLREVRTLQAAGKPIVNMGIGSPDLVPDVSVMEAVQEAMLQPAAHQYQSYQGLPELRQAMAAFYSKNFKVVLNPDTEILPLMGSKEGILHIAMAFLNEGDGVLIPNPGYPTYASVAKLVGAESILYDLAAENNWEPDFEALEKQDLSRVKLMWVSYPHMPTGAAGSEELFRKLIAFAKKHQILLVNDNPYSFILNNKPASVLNIPGAMEVAMELNSLSKTFNMAGWRVGMVMGKQELIEAVLKVKSNMDSGMFYGIQKGAIAALKSDPEWFEQQNRIYEKRRNLVFELAGKLNCTYDENSVGLFVWARLPKEETSSEAFVDKLLYEKDLFIAPGTIFGSNGEGYIRFSLCIPEEKIEAILKRF